MIFNGLATRYPDGVEMLGTLPDFSLFTDLLSVEFTAVGPDAYLSIDDIAVTASVPVPAAVWFFASVIASLGWLRRRKLVRTSLRQE